jgi:predicted ATP-binding protein involved in virulence
MIVPVHELHIQNFRGIRTASIPLDPRVTVFFGSNAAGKTSVLHALTIGLGAIIARVPNTVGRGFANSGDIRRPWLTRQEVGEEAEVECPFARVAIVAGDGLRWDVTKHRSQPDRSRVPKSWGLAALHSWLDPRILEAQDTPPGKPTSPIPLVAAYGTERAVVEVPLRERDFNRNVDRFKALDQALQATTHFKSVFEWFRVMEDEERRGMEQHRDFDYRLPALQWVRRAVAAAGLRCSNPRVETQPIRMIVDFEHETGEKQWLDISSLSDGYRTHFALVVDLARRMVQLNPSDDLDDPVRGTNTASVVVIDEVDLHLDPAWQGRVVQGLLAAFPNTQFVLTTHSEQVVASIEASQVRRLRWGHGEVFVEDVPFAQGATGERILVDLMGAPQRVPGRVTDELERYMRLVREGKGREEEASELRQELEDALPGDPMLQSADLEMQRQQLMLRFQEKADG